MAEIFLRGQIVLSHPTTMPSTKYIQQSNIEVIVMFCKVVAISKINITIPGIVSRNSTTNTQFYPTTENFISHHLAQVGLQKWLGEEEGPTHSTSTPTQSVHLCGTQ